MDYQTIISCEQLAQIQSDSKVVILDASIPPVGKMAKPTHSWPMTIIPGALRFDLDGDFSDHHAKYPHTMVNESVFQQKSRMLGINQDTQIVVYDNLGLFSAARAWWMFKSMGHHRVAVLDGGLPAWIKAKHLTTTFEPSDIPHGNFVAEASVGYFKNAEHVLHVMNTTDTTIVDARANNRFKGEVPEPRAGVRSGHIPGSKNVPYGNLLNDGLLKPVGALEQIWQSIAPPEQALILSCGSGVTACVLALSASLAGYKNLSVFDGSWSEWGTDTQYPVETG